LNISGAQAPWVMIDCDAPLAASIAREINVPQAVGRILVNRGIANADDARKFLSPSLDDLHDPGLLPDIEVGVGRVEQALRSGEKIFVYGDYDVASGRG